MDINFRPSLTKNAILPDLPLVNLQTELRSIILTPLEVYGKVGTNYSALKPAAVQLLSEFEKSWSSPN